MKTTIEFLNAVKERYNLPSDGRLAVKLELTRASISRFMLGKDFLGDETAMKVAALLDIDPSYVTACIHSERAKQPAVKAMWKHTAEVLYGLAAVLAVIAILPYSPIHWDGFNAALAGITGIEEGGALYIMSNTLCASYYHGRSLPKHLSPSTMA